MFCDPDENLFMMEKFVLDSPKTFSGHCRNRIYVFIFSIIVLHITLTDATGYYSNISNVSSSKQRILLTLVVVEKPRLQNFNVYLARAGKPFEPSQIATSQPYNVSKMVLKFDKPTTEVLNDRTFSNQNDTRPKRGVVSLFNMISCATGCNPLTYKKYGCYCGFLGSGTAVDGIDKCCQHHDWCYSAANCPMWSEYFIPYYWICRRNEPLCAIHHGEWGGPTSCAYKLCDCDRKLAMCLSRYLCPSSRALCTSSPLRFLQNIL